MTRVLAIGALACALTGCGTMGNFQRESLTQATPYGGVRIAADGFTPDAADFVAIDYPRVLCAADVALSAVGDTLTLPVTLSLTAWRVGTRVWALAHYDNTPPANNAWREFGFDGRNAAPEGVHGGVQREP